MLKVKLNAFGLILLALLVGCSSGSKKQQAPIEEESYSQVAEQINLGEQEAIAAGDQLGSVHFLYNKVFIPYEYRKVVRAHADFMQENPELLVILQGNADIGGRKQTHNKIGLQRAEVVKERLVSFGVDPARISIATYGSDKPVAEGDSSEDWQMNRRVDFIYYL